MNNYLNPDPKRLRQDESYRQKVFEKLQKQFSDDICRYCSHRFGETEADDLVQEVFLAVWANLHKFKRDAAIRTWIIGIARNQGLKMIRDRSRRMAIIERFGEAIIRLLHPGIERLPEDEDSETGDRLTECLKKLKDYERVLFNLRYLKKQSYNDIAEVSGKSSDAVRQSVHRILKKLRDCMR